jgi:hypothetical protein
VHFLDVPGKAGGDELYRNLGNWFEVRVNERSQSRQKGSAVPSMFRFPSVVVLGELQR